MCLGNCTESCKNQIKVHWPEFFLTFSFASAFVLFTQCLKIPQKSLICKITSEASLLFIRTKTRPFFVDFQTVCFSLKEASETPNHFFFRKHFGLFIAFIPLLKRFLGIYLQTFFFVGMQLMLHST